MSPRHLLATTASAALLAGGLVGLAPTAASAAYTTVTTVHGANLQACRATVGGDPAVRFRLDNRAGRHAHRGSVSRERGGVSRTFSVQPAAGRVSAVKTVRLRSGDRLVSGIQDLDGPGAGGGFSRGDLRAC